jgi:hypothetical protein
VMRSPPQQTEVVMIGRRAGCAEWMSPRWLSSIREPTRRWSCCSDGRCVTIVMGIICCCAVI